MTRSLSIAAPVWALLFASFAFADVRLKIETFGPQGDLEETGWAYIEGDRRLRLEPEVNDRGEPLDNSIIFDALSESFVVIDHEQEEYLLLDRERIGQLSGRIKSALDEMREQLDQLPAEQRKILEEAMKTQKAAGPAEISSEVREMGVDDGATLFEVWVNGKSVSRVWTKPPEQIGIPLDAVGVFRKMSAFYDEVMRGLAASFPDALVIENPFAGVSAMKGFPVRMLEVGSKRETRISVDGLEDLDPALFIPPSDYQERKVDEE